VATPIIDTGPPYRFWPLRRIVGVQWSGEKCYVLLQFFSQEGDVQIEIPDQPKRFDDKGKLIQDVHKDSKVVYSRNKNTPGEGYEGIFLIEVNKMPKPDPVTGKVPAVFTAKVKGVEKPVDPNRSFCATSTLRFTTGPYTVTRVPSQDDGIFLAYNLFRHKTASMLTPNGFLYNDAFDELIGFGRTAGDPRDNTLPGGVRWSELLDSTVFVEEAVDHEMWVLDPATGRFQNLHIPCREVDVRVPSKTKFSFTGYLFSPKADFQVDPPTSDLDTPEDDGAQLGGHVRRRADIRPRDECAGSGGRRLSVLRAAPQVQKVRSAD
jgi:hypothetical protein